MHIEEIKGKFRNVKLNGADSILCACPSHKDDKPSLCITEKDNKLLFNCFAGCDTRNILSAIGLTEKDLFNDEKIEKPKIVAEYIYTDEKNNPLYKVIRYEPKNFRQCKYDNGNWIWKMTNVRYVLYNLSNVIKSDIIYFVEGEKDADNLNKIGLCATTTVSGAASFNKRSKDYAYFLKDKIVYIIPDNDQAGYGYAEDIKEAISVYSKEVKVLKLINEIPDLKEKQDISDVLLKFGKEKTLEIINKLVYGNKEELEIEFDEDNVCTIEVFDKLYRYELSNLDKYYKLYNEIKKFCRDNKITGFDKQYKKYKDSKEVKTYNSGMSLIFPEKQEVYNTNKYEISQEGFIYEVVPNIGKILVCYHPIIPIEKYNCYEDGTEKIKLGYYIRDSWHYIIVEKDIIANVQSIVKLSNLGISVNSDNAKHLIKYLAEMENLNKDLIKVNVSTSRLGWVNDVLMPYSEEYVFDNDKEIPNVSEKFSQKGDLNTWADFFRERRKYNSISQIIMASGISSIILKSIKQTGFTVHVWGTSEYGKSVSCLAAQSIFGNPMQGGNGIGINFNFTPAGLEYRLNAYNNLPLFINEMQHQKDASDYDKILFLIAEGQGKSRSTKFGGLGKENNWNNIVITNGEKNIIKSNSNAGAYNRCISLEMSEHSYENLPEVADFAKENYGTAIREILNKIKDYDIKSIFKENLKKVSELDTTDKQKIMVAVLLTGDKILTDIIFKDEYYIDYNEFTKWLTSKNETSTDIRALEVVKDWYVSESRHFLECDENNSNDKLEIYGKKLKDDYVAFIPGIMKDKLEQNRFDFTEVVKAWKIKDIIMVDSDRKRNTKKVRIGGKALNCIVLKMSLDSDEDDNYEIEMERPF